MPILPNENRSVLQSLEQAENIPTGLLQGLYEKRTGWRPNLNFLPDYMLPENERGENKTEQEVMAQDLAGAKMVRANLDMFGGNEALASHAFNFSPETTQDRLKEGKFPQDEVDTVFDVAKRKADIVGQQITPQDIDQFASMLGTKPSDKVIKQKQPPRPEPQKPVSLKRSEDGTYYTGDPLYDALLKLDSGNTNPQESFVKLKRQVKKNERALSRAGVPINPTTLYLAQQKSPKDAIQLWGNVQSGDTQSVSQYKMIEQQVNNGMDPIVNDAAIDTAPQPQVDVPKAQMQDMTPQVPLPSSDIKSASTQYNKVTIKDADWGEIADRVFSSKKQSYENKTVNKAISGLLTGIV